MSDLKGNGIVSPWSDTVYIQTPDLVQDLSELLASLLTGKKKERKKERKKRTML